MQKLLRTLAVLAFLSFGTLLRADHSTEFSNIAGGSTLTVEILGNWDGSFAVVDMDTNQIVAEGTFLVNFFPGAAYVTYGSSYVPESTVEAGDSLISITNLPPGNYRVTTHNPSYGTSAGATWWYEEYWLWYGVAIY